MLRRSPLLAETEYLSSARVLNSYQPASTTYNRLRQHNIVWNPQVRNRASFVLPTNVVFVTLPLLDKFNALCPEWKQQHQYIIGDINGNTILILMLTFRFVFRQNLDAQKVVIYLLNLIKLKVGFEIMKLQDVKCWILRKVIFCNTACMSAWSEDLSIV